MGRRANLRLSYLAAVNSAPQVVTISASRPKPFLLRASSPGVPSRATETPSTAITVTPSLAPALAQQAPAAAKPATTPAAAATPAAIIAQFCPSGIAKQPCGCSVDTTSMQTLFQNSIQSRLLLWPPPDAKFANCSAVGGLNTAQKAGTVASAAGGITTALTSGAAPLIATGAAIPVIGIGVAAIGTLISAIGAHHARAVAAQNNALCTAVPAVNAALQQIDQELAAGTLTPAQAVSYYGQIQSQFTTTLKAGTSYKQCDALYAYNLALQMVLAARKRDLQTSATGAAAGAAGAVAQLATNLGVPPALLWGAAGLALYLALK